MVTVFNPVQSPFKLFFSWQINLSVRLSNLTSLYLGWKYFSAFRSILQHFVCRIKLRNFDAVYFLEKIEIRSEFNFEIWREIRNEFFRSSSHHLCSLWAGRPARGRAGQAWQGGVCQQHKSPREIPQQFPSTFCATRNCYVWGVRSVMVMWPFSSCQVMIANSAQLK